MHILTRKGTVHGNRGRGFSLFQGSQGFLSKGCAGRSGAGGVGSEPRKAEYATEGRWECKVGGDLPQRMGLRMPWTGVSWAEFWRIVDAECRLGMDLGPCLDIGSDLS